MVTEVNFGQINNWGTWTNEQFLKKKVMDTNHPDYDNFIIELEKLNERKNKSNVKIMTNF